MAAIVNPNWHLRERLSALSRAPWPQCLSEWSLRDIQMLDPEDIAGTCLCGHAPIRELCFIYNQTTSEDTILGNHCIRFITSQEDVPEGNIFSSIPKVFNAAKRILDDPERSANEELIAFAQRQNVFTANDAHFYRDIMAKRSLSDRQLQYKMRLNKKLCDQIILTAKAAYRILIAHPTETISLKLIERAFQRVAISPYQRDCYRDFWNRTVRGNHPLTPQEITIRNQINQQIINSLRDMIN